MIYLTWLWHSDRNQKSSHPRERPRRRAYIWRSDRKHVFRFFMDRKIMVLQHQLPDGHTVNAQYNSNVIYIFYVSFLILNSLNKKMKRTKYLQNMLHWISEKDSWKKLLNTQFLLAFLCFGFLSGSCTCFTEETSRFTVRQIYPASRQHSMPYGKSDIDWNRLFWFWTVTTT